MSPSNLHHSDFRIAEIIDDIFQEILSGKKIGIKDGDELTGRELHPILQRTRFETATVLAMDVVDVESHRPILFNTRAGNLYSTVRGIIQNLNLQQFTWIADVACRLDQTFYDVQFVVYR